MAAGRLAELIGVPVCREAVKEPSEVLMDPHACVEWALAHELHLELQLGVEDTLVRKHSMDSGRRICLAPCDVTLPREFQSLFMEHQGTWLKVVHVGFESRHHLGSTLVESLDRAGGIWFDVFVFACIRRYKGDSVSDLEAKGLGDASCAPMRGPRGRAALGSALGSAFRLFRRLAAAAAPRPPPPLPPGLDLHQRVVLFLLHVCVLLEEAHMFDLCEIGVERLKLFCNVLAEVLCRIELECPEVEDFAGPSQAIVFLEGLHASVLGLMSGIVVIVDAVQLHVREELRTLGDVCPLRPANAIEVTRRLLQASGLVGPLFLGGVMEEPRVVVGDQRIATPTPVSHTPVARVAEQGPLYRQVIHLAERRLLLRVDTMPVGERVDGREHVARATLPLVVNVVYT
mmetsp:Transcript_19939/g.50189  ORF Transcript_19939/g.50189 Transcript_19939/m.50189 type:complete len:401 (+) Transcript_19939:107-1309(+)